MRSALGSTTLAVVALFGVAVGLSGAARADEGPANCKVRIIHALPDGKGIDPQITVLKSHLEKPAFATFKGFTLLDKRDIKLAPKATEKFSLPNGKVATLTYVEHIQRQDGKQRVRLRLEIDNPGDKGRLLDTTFVLDEGGVVLQAGQKHAHGQLILAFSCDTKG